MLSVIQTDALHTQFLAHRSCGFARAPDQREGDLPRRPTRSRRGDEFIARGFSAFESCRRQGAT